MAPWLLFGAGGKGVGARTLELALTEQRPLAAVVRHADTATKLAQQGVQVLLATPVMPAWSRRPAVRLARKRLSSQQWAALRIIWPTER